MRARGAGRRGRRRGRRDLRRGRGAERDYRLLEGGRLTLSAGGAGAGHLDGSADRARFDQPLDLALAAGQLYVADAGNHAIRAVTILTGDVTTLAGEPTRAGDADGFGRQALFRWPAGLALDGLGNLYVADQLNRTIRLVRLADGWVETLAGVTARAGVALGPTPAGLNWPGRLAAGADGTLYIPEVAESALLVLQ